MVQFTVLLAVRTLSRWHCPFNIVGQLFASRVLSHWKHNLGALSWLNAEALERAPTPLLVCICQFHGPESPCERDSSYILLTQAWPMIIKHLQFLVYGLINIRHLSLMSCAYKVVSCKYGSLFATLAIVQNTGGACTRDVTFSLVIMLSLPHIQ